MIREGHKLFFGIFKLSAAESFFVKRAKREQEFKKALNAVKFFYYLSLVWILGILPIDLLGLFDTGRPFKIWPLFWTKYFPADIASTLILLIVSLCFLIGLFFFWHYLGRLVIFLGLFLFLAVSFSMGYQWEWHPWLNTAFVFIFLPNFKKVSTIGVREKTNFLIAFWGAQALMLIAYTFAGLNKIFAYAGEDWRYFFNPYVFSNTVAFSSSRDLSDTFFSALFVNYPVLSYPAYLLAFYLQLFSFWVAIKTSLQKLWAIGLIIFHLGTGLIFGIVFVEMVILLFLFFYQSPFLDSKKSLSELIFELPLIGWLVKPIEKIYTRRGFHNA